MSNKILTLFVCVCAAWALEEEHGTTFRTRGPDPSVLLSTIVILPRLIFSPDCAGTRKMTGNRKARITAGATNMWLR